MADMTRIKGRIAETIYPNGTGAITAESHQALLLEMVDDINAKKADQLELIATQESLDALEQKVDNLPQGEEFDKQGNYPLLHVGTADDLAGRGESVPASFGFRASGGKSIKDGRAYIKAIKGNSVVWNQLFEPNASDRSYEANGVHVVDNRDGSYTIWTDEGGATQTTTRGIATTHNLNYLGHKLLVLGIKGAFDGFGLNDIYSNSFLTVFKNNAIVTASQSGNVTFSIYVAAGKVIQRTTWKPRVIDLTKAFPNDWQNINTIEDFNARKPIVEDEYAYNEGEVIHCNTESIKSVGDNAWDEEWESGIINYSTGNDTNSANHCRTVGYTQVIPNEQYYISFPTASYSSDLVVICYDENKAFIQHIGGGSANKTFRIPTNCHYIRFTWNGTQYANNIMLTLVHSGWKQDTDAGYQPYWQDTLPLPIIRKYFPDGMKMAGSAHDEIRFNKASGKWEYSKGKIKSVDLGGFNWSMSSETYPRFFAKTSGTALPPDVNSLANLLCVKYDNKTAIQTYQGEEGISLDPQEYLRVYDPTYTDAATFKAAMAGVILYYEAAEWEWVELDAEDQNFRDYYKVADFGTEQAQSNVPSAAFSADIIYQFNAVDMIREHEIEITELQSIIATMQAQLTSLINGGQ